MRRFATAAFLLVFMLLPASTSAAPRALGFRDGFRLADNIKIPAEWAGIWTTTDSLYDCNDVLQQVTSSTDTLCAGVDIADFEEIQFDCTGSADANSVNMTCTGFAQIVEDCEAHYTFVFQGTRTGETAVLFNESSVHYEGEGVGCEFLPDQCTRTRATSTRTAPAPSVYCSTPTLPSTLGRVKAIYR